MTRMPVPTRDQAPTASQPMLDDVIQQFGFLPNAFRVAALSPAVLTGLTALSSALQSTLDESLRGKIALAVSSVNGSPACIATHTRFAERTLRMTPEEVAQSLAGHAAEARTDAALCFAVSVADTRGNVRDSDVEKIRAAGYDDAQIVEIIAAAVYYLFTNFINNVCKPDLDYLFSTEEALRHGP
jgi:uncharacterized peroxidase-related enzyme